MKVIILFTYPKHPTIIGKLIAVAMGTKFDHVCIQIDNMAFGRNMVFQAAETSVQLIPLDTLLLNHKIIAKHEILLDNLQYGQMIKFLFAALGQFYSFFGLLGMGLKLLFHGRNPFSDGHKTMFCSEYVLGALQHAGMLLQFEPEQTSPKDIFEALEAK
jgi:hypothetical protein